MTRLTQLRKKAEAGDLIAQHELGLSCAILGLDDAEAVKWISKAAEQGHAPAQNSLGRMYADGAGIEKDYTEAVKWYCKAAEQGHVFAQNKLGSMYDDGQGVEKDYAEAVKWYRKAAEQGDALGQYNLGLMYFFGHGVEKDIVDGYAWVNLAAAKDFKQAEAEARDILEKQMTPQQIAAAQKRTEELKKLTPEKQAGSK